MLAKPSLILSRRSALIGLGVLAVPKPLLAVGSSQWPLVGTPILGNVGGTANVWQAADQTLTRPANTTAYAAGGALGSATSVIFSFGDLVNFPSSVGFFRKPNSSAILNGLRLSCSLAGGIATTAVGSVFAHLYQTAPSAASGLADQNQYPNLQADAPIKLGAVQFSTWVAGGTGSDVVESYGAPLLSQQAVIAAAATQSLFVVCVSVGAFTPVSAAIWHLHASSTGD